MSNDEKTLMCRAGLHFYVEGVCRDCGDIKMVERKPYGTCRACHKLPASREGCFCIKCLEDKKLTASGAKELLSRIEYLESLVGRLK